MTVQSRLQATHTTQTVSLPTLKIGEEDSTYPYRLVGSYEYGKSLEELGELADTSTTEEIEVYDKLIEMNPEYSFYSGVVSDLGLDATFGSLNESAQEEMDSKYQKQSLAWMLALARVELGATISMYGRVNDPFGAAVAAGGQEFGGDEFLSILMDDLAAHLKTAQQDQDYQRAFSPEQEIDESSLPYLRRTQLINHLLTKVMESGKPEIVMQVKPYADEFRFYEGKLIEKLTAATTPKQLRFQSLSAPKDGPSKVIVR